MRIEVRAYRIARPLIGHRAALWFSGMAPGFALAAAGVLLFWIFFSVFPATKGGDSSGECGSRITWDC